MNKEEANEKAEKMERMVYDGLMRLSHKVDESDISSNIIIHDSPRNLMVSRYGGYPSRMSVINMVNVDDKGKFVDNFPFHFDYRWDNDSIHVLRTGKDRSTGDGYYSRVISFEELNEDIIDEILWDLYKSIPVNSEE